MARRRNVSAMEVMEKPCGTCPFGGAHRSPLSPEGQSHYLKQIVELRSQHLCHTVDNRKLCRGARDIMLRVMVAMKLIDEPTDAAFAAKSKEVLNAGGS